MKVAWLRGASQIIVVGKNAARLQLAGELVANIRLSSLDKLLVDSQEFCRTLDQKAQPKNTKE